MKQKILTTCSLLALLCCDYVIADDTSSSSTNSNSNVSLNGQSTSSQSSNNSNTKSTDNDSQSNNQNGNINKGNSDLSLSDQSTSSQSSNNSNTKSTDNNSQSNNQNGNINSENEDSKDQTLESNNSDSKSNNIKNNQESVLGSNSSISDNSDNDSESTDSKETDVTSNKNTEDSSINDTASTDYLNSENFTPELKDQINAFQKSIAQVKEMIEESKKAKKFIEFSEYLINSKSSIGKNVNSKKGLNAALNPSEGQSPLLLNEEQKQNKTIISEDQNDNVKSYFNQEKTNEINQLLKIITSIKAQLESMDTTAIDIQFPSEDKYIETLNSFNPLITTAIQHLSFTSDLNQMDVKFAENICIALLDSDSVFNGLISIIDYIFIDNYNDIISKIKDNYLVAQNEWNNVKNQKAKTEKNNNRQILEQSKLNVKFNELKKSLTALQKKFKMDKKTNQKAQTVITDPEFSASSEFDKKHLAKNAFDGNVDTYWGSKEKDKSPYLQIDLPNAEAYNVVKITSRKDENGYYSQQAPGKFEILASNDKNFKSFDTLFSAKETVKWQPNKSETKEFKFPNTKEYTSYRIKMTGKTASDQNYEVDNYSLANISFDQAKDDNKNSESEEI